VDPFDLDVAGAARPPAQLVVTKNEAVMSGIRMVMTANKPLRSMEDIVFNLAVMDAATSAPVTNLQPYLGAWAHIAIISEDTKDFLHVHPMEEQGQLSAAAARPGQPTPSTIRMATGFRHPGLYKMWVQVQRNGVVTAHPFVFQVAAAATLISQGPRPPAGATLVKVSSSGFEPATIQAKAGQPLKLAFYRPDAANCAREVVFPDIGIRRDLPVGQTVVVDITPSKSGSVGFECGMKMLKGTLIVK
jgi:Cupredoxin-like domain